jgi:NIPSNAP
MSMLIDHRTYTLRPGTMAKHLAIYEEYGMKAQKRHLGEPLAFLVAESGELNTYVHIWVYQDAADRATRRAAMQADPEWQAYLQKSGEAGYLIKQVTKLMTPAPFAPINR